jgi:ATPase subunit of ABC transporter with duplicated ATPase domains
VNVAFGGLPLLDRVHLQVEKGERVCLLGRNGEGKTTILRLISGEIEPDSGVITLNRGVKVAGLSQELPPNLRGSVYDVVADGLGGIGSLLEEYQQLTRSLAKGADKAEIKKIEMLCGNWMRHMTDGRSWKVSGRQTYMQRGQAFKGNYKVRQLPSSDDPLSSG